MAKFDPVSLPLQGEINFIFEKIDDFEYDLTITKIVAEKFGFYCSIKLQY